MKNALKLAAALVLSLPVVLGSPASAAVGAGPAAVIGPSSDDNPIYVLVGQATVDLARLSGNEDRNQPQ